MISPNLYGAENHTSKNGEASRQTPTYNAKEPHKITTDLSSTANESISGISRPVDTYHTENGEKKKNEGPNESWWFKFRTDPVATFTLILAIATGLLWWSTRKLVLGAEDTAMRQLRAYVHNTSYVALPILDNDRKITAWQFGIMWENVGQTPAVRLKMGCSLQLGSMPGPGINFVTPINETSLGPKYPYRSLASPSISQAQAMDIAAGKLTAYLCGLAEYNDVFVKTPIRRTRVCMKIDVAAGEIASPSAFTYISVGYNDAT